MPSSYKAVLHGDRIEWIGSSPDCRQPVSVHITLEEDASAPRSRGDEMANALHDLASEGGLSSISDPTLLSP